jgi:hypothetical protein
MRDFKRMQTDPPAGVSASPIADNVMTWYGNTANTACLFARMTNL